MNLPDSARFNILLATGARVATLGAAVLSVPVLLGLLGTERYGTWATLTSLVAFISLLDLGVGNSVRNSVAARERADMARVHDEFVGLFQLLGVIGVAGLGVFVLLLGRAELLARNPLAAGLLYAPLLVLLPCLLGANVLQGAKATGLQAALQASGGLVFLGLIGLLAWQRRAPSLAQLAAAWSGFYAIALLVAFGLALRVLRLPVRRLWHPFLRALPWPRVRLGLGFLTLQLASLTLFGLGNLLVFRQLGAGEAARYDVLNKVFQAGLSLFTTFIGVMWVEIARHRASADARALRRVYGRLAAVAGLFAAAALAGAALAPWVIYRWTGQRVQITRPEAFAVAGLVATQALAYVGAVFMNAFERIRAQIVVAGVALVLMVPLSSLFMAQGLGIASVPCAALLLTLPSLVVCHAIAWRLVRDAGP